MNSIIRQAPFMGEIAKISGLTEINGSSTQDICHLSELTHNTTNSQNLSPGVPNRRNKTPPVPRSKQWVTPQQRGSRPGPVTAAGRAPDAHRAAVPSLPALLRGLRGAFAPSASPRPGPAQAPHRERSGAARPGSGPGARRGGPLGSPSPQRRYRRPEARTCGEVQRAGLPACRVAAVHVLGPHQPLDPLHVPVPAGLEELPGRLPAGAAARRLGQGGRTACAPPRRHAGPGPLEAAEQPPPPRSQAAALRGGSSTHAPLGGALGPARRCAAEGSGRSSGGAAAGLPAQARSDRLGTRRACTRGQSH